VAVKLAVVGGGSTYTPELIEGIARRSSRLAVDELVLLDIDPERLEIVGGLAQRMLDRLGWPGRLTLTGDQDAAIEGASFVLLQLRVGGQAARLVDETLPPTYGTIGQETTGAGGFAKALRTVPLVLSIAEEVGRRAAPGAWIVDFTNPVGIVTQALLDEGHRAIGLCNVAIGFQREFAKRYGVDPERVELEHVGLNHLSWERAVKVDGVDRLPEILAGEGAAEIAGWVGSPTEIVRVTRSIPSYYLKYYYRFDDVLAGQSDGSQTRAEEVMDIEGELLDMYRNPNLDEKPKLLERRGGAFYSEAAAQLIASLHDGRGDIQVVDIRNGPMAGAGGPRALPDLPDDVVVEVPARITQDGAVPLELAPLSPDMRGLVQAVKAYEQLTIEAAMTGSRDVALRALIANPLVARWSIAGPLLEPLLEANRRYLPRFFAADAAGAADSAGAIAR
jgi:6-phospho-beta-glucosidase